MNSDNTLIGKYTGEKYREHCTEFMHDMIVQCNVESREHIWYVKQYSKILAGTYAKLFPRSRMTKKKQEMIVMAAQIHDIGKIAIPDHILNRPGHLSGTDFEILKKHTIKGSQMIKSMSWNIDKDFERICYNVCLYHHEKYDGSGYPYGIRENRIPIEAQIVALADMYDILIHCGRNRTVCMPGSAYVMLMKDRCGGLSPKIKECLHEARRMMEEVDIENK